ncbi:uncharacterized protein MYCFIDRAFT_83604 [Pseudocercospora fijiensis CIRAD86]|uniref:Xylanolytic transcriptional activator regulatory domain-containing protein n=1 Tax=Pseudocercospora fijiensis (strain CIRAD86) TaxID=383855 RepID=M2ZT02_PSEFD|nr:uncharacterized protein MYCFIDRAFT_83604 [Pseudocercospora fijiensis CIRAD86]EME82144.1 hypothetical protein MYCFIDRAFT_83604 [Pseudocercospora fijiensis CIRAD86]
MDQYLELQRRKILASRSQPYQVQSNVVAVREPTRKSYSPTPTSPGEDSVKIQTLEDELRKLAERLAAVEARPEPRNDSPTKHTREKEDAAAKHRRRSSSVASFVAVEPTIPELEETTPSAEKRASGSNFLFHFENDTNAKSQQQHLTPKRLWAMWQQYTSSVDPLLKVLHVPAVQHLFLSTDEEKAQVSLDAEALKYAICFAAAASLEQSAPDASSCPSARPLSSTYACRLESTLAKSGFMSKPTIQAVQALAIYLICGQHFLDANYVWCLTAVLVRLALKLKTNRDPETQGLSFLDCEYRRRLWWHICSLDARVAEVNGTDPLVYERQCTSRFPVGIQDSEFDSLQDLDAKRNSQAHAPDMFFALLRFETTYYMRTVLYSDDFMEDNGWPILPTDGKLSIIESLEKILEEKYWCRCQCGSSVCRLAIASSKTTVARLKLSAIMSGRDLTQLSNQDMEEVMSASATVLESLRTIRSEPGLSRWMWLCPAYAEWDAVSVCLAALLLARWRSKAATRAWTAVNTFFVAWKESSYNPELYKRWNKLENLKLKIEKLQRHQSSSPLRDQSNSSLYSSTASLIAPNEQRRGSTTPNSPSPLSPAHSKLSSVSSKSTGSVRSAFEDQNWPLSNALGHEDVQYDLKLFALMI